MGATSPREKRKISKAAETAERRKRIGCHLRWLRDKKGVSQEYIEAQLDIAQTNLSAMERGVIEPKGWDLHRILKLLDVSIFEFFDEGKMDEAVKACEKLKRRRGHGRGESPVYVVAKPEKGKRGE